MAEVDGVLARHVAGEVAISDAGASAAEADLDMAGAIAAVRRHARMILSAAGLCGLVALAVVNLMAPRYAAEVRVVIENRETALTRAGKERANSQDEAVKLDPEAISSQVQIAYSRDLARTVIRDLNLVSLGEFNPLVNAGGILPGALGIIGLGRDIARLAPEERALEAYFERLSVAPVDKSRVIEIRFWSTDPELSARVANAISERFIEFQTRAKLERDRRVRQYFEVKIDELRTNVAEAEGKVQLHRSENDLLTGANSLPLSSQSLSELTAQFTTAQGQQAEAEARARSIRDLLKSGKPIESAEVFASPLMQRLTERGAALRAEHALQTTVLLPGHPRMRELQAQLADNQQQVRAQAERIARSLENDARAAGERLRSVQQALDSKKRSTSSNGDKEVQLRALEREAKVQRDLLEDWLALYRDAAARDSLEARVADARIVSRAEPSNTPFFPKKMPIVLIAALAALTIGVAIVVALALMKGPVRAAAERKEPRRREPELSYPLLAENAGSTDTATPAAEAAVPADAISEEMDVNPSQSETQAATDDRHDEVAKWRADLDREHAEADKAMPYEETRRTAPELAQLAARLLVVTAVTSARDEVALTLELALGLAARGRRVVIIDAHRGADSLAREAGIRIRCDLGDIASGRAAIVDALARIPGSAVHLIAANADGGSDIDFAALSQPLAALAMTYDSLVVRTASLTQARDLIRLAGGAASIAIAAEAQGDPLALAARRTLSLKGVGDILVLPRHDRGTRRTQSRAA